MQREKRGPPGKLRIVAGSLRGSKLAVPDRPGLRPTSDRVRETLFNWLMPVIEGARCLDLYAGTGALGIEAISRGAGACTFVESDRAALGIEAISRGAGACTFVESDRALARDLRENLARLKIESARVIEGDALSILAGRAEPFDIVFLDPPFSGDLWDASAERLETHGWLAPNGWIYVESPAGATLALPDSWKPYREGQAGAVRFALYRRAAADPVK